MKKQYRSPLMAPIHETAEGLHAAGVLRKRTMLEFDERCLTPIRPLKPEEQPALLVSGPAEKNICRALRST